MKRKSINFLPEQFSTRKTLVKAPEPYGSSGCQPVKSHWNLNNDLCNDVRIGERNAKPSLLNVSIIIIILRAFSKQ